MASSVSSSNPTTLRALLLNEDAIVRLDPDAARGEVRFEAVSYRYPDGDVDVLRDIDLVIDAGE